MEKAKKKWLTPGILALFMASTTIGAVEFTAIGIQKELAEYYGKTDCISEIGMLVTVFAVGLIIGTPIIMVLTSKINRSKLLSASMILLIAATAIPLLTKNYNVMLVFRIIQSVLCGAIGSCAYLLGSELAPAEHKTKAMTLINSGYSVSSVFVIPIVSIIATNFDVIGAHVFIIIMQVICQIIIMLFVHCPTTEWKGNIEDEKKLIKDKRILLALIIPMFAVGATYTVFSYIETIFTTCYEIPTKHISVLLFIFGILCIISNVISAYAESRGGIRTLKYSFMAQFAVLIGISLAMGSTDSNNWPIGIVITLMLGLVMYFMCTPILSYYIRVAKNDYPGGVPLSSCFLSIAFNLGVSLGSTVGGFVINQNGMLNLGYVAAAIVVVAIIMAIVLERWSSPSDIGGRQDSE